MADSSTQCALQTVIINVQNALHEMNEVTKNLKITRASLIQVIHNKINELNDFINEKQPCDSKFSESPSIEPPTRESMINDLEPMRNTITDPEITSNIDLTIFPPPDDTSNSVNKFPQSPKSAARQVNICKFHIKKSCRFGPNGIGCKFTHPQICSSLYSSGECLNNQCCSSHPTMCRNSLNSKHCHQRHCGFLHVEGTASNSIYDPRPPKPFPQKLSQSSAINQLPHHYSPFLEKRVDDITSQLQIIMQKINLISTSGLHFRPHSHYQKETASNQLIKLHQQQ